MSSEAVEDNPDALTNKKNPARKSGIFLWMEALDLPRPNLFLPASTSSIIHTRNLPQQRLSC